MPWSSGIPAGVQLLGATPVTLTKARQEYKAPQQPPASFLFFCRLWVQVGWLRKIILSLNELHLNAPTALNEQMGMVTKCISPLVFRMDSQS